MRLHENTFTQTLCNKSRKALRFNKAWVEKSFYPSVNEIQFSMWDGIMRHSGQKT